jgi:hypothetical protein
MGIFDVFKTKVSGPAHKAGDVAGDVTDKDRAKDSKQATASPEQAAAKTAATPTADAEEAAQMVSEGAPVAEAGEAAPGVGDDGASNEDGMTGTIKQNVAGGAEKAGQFVDEKTGGKFSDQVDAGVQKTKDTLS